MKTKTFIIAVILGLVAFWGCDDNSTGANGGSIIGNWENSILDDGDLFTVTLKFIESGNLQIVLEEEGGVDNETINGSYNVSDSDLTILDEQCGDIVGNYSFQINSNGLTLSVISDDCEGRANTLTMFPDPWSRIN